MSFVYFILILGITIFIHELGHFIFAKKAGVHVYEFSIGMGPKIFKRNRKNDETDYCIRLFPIGGFVSMAGEDEIDDKIDSDKQLSNKTFTQKLSVMFAGVIFNFLLAIILIFILGIFVGVPNTDPVISNINEGYSIENTDITVGDTIVSINNKKTKSTSDLVLELSVNENKNIDLEYMNSLGEIKSVNVSPIEGKYGFEIDNSVSHNFIDILVYPIKRFSQLVRQMFKVIFYLIIGVISLSSLSGPIGIYKVVEQSAALGIVSMIELIIYLCINVGIINILPLPALDGGRIFFLILEKILNKKIKYENQIHFIGFILLMLLAIVVTYSDIINLII